MTNGSDDKKKPFIPRIFALKGKMRMRASDCCLGYPEACSTFGSENLTGDSNAMSCSANVQSFRIFVSTWNVGGKSPHSGLNLDSFLSIDDPSDIYVLGFQEIVPLNAGNVLVIEDGEPAAKWLALINQSLNKPRHNLDATRGSGSRLLSKDLRHASSFSFFQKASSLKVASKSFKPDCIRRLKICNCPSEVERKNRDSCFKCQQPSAVDEDSSEEEEGSSSTDAEISRSDLLNYSLITCKQMVGIFVTVWVKNELLEHIGHLRVSSVGRGIMGYLGNKGCISVSMSLHQTTFCFVCSHLASGEKEGDELRRNSDVIETMKNTQFRKICKNLNRRIPERILEHDRIIWLGDLNYRIALSYSETRLLLANNNWDSLLEKDQLKIEREAGRVFKGWDEGKIFFPPTYKYSYNSDNYAGEAEKSREKRRTPAWCDRILWHGRGIRQLSYIRCEMRFSDHRPVCAVFVADVKVLDSRTRKLLSSSPMKVAVEELLPKNSNY